ncbi:hypothetical protein [Nonomuraea jiangxiensis]|uniref:Uncharacterized protein n=1 Tax=Nonomuraea jiangxiensis TaxID=633440 RepID=A0A1G9GUE8_9ACTN|nr:hypothetical protein [Nonomuraea jiangxiensis]SDL04309.1 hypothetical protein SAMN05421869_121147 [Nonomuraea jiangxiensis]
MSHNRSGLLPGLLAGLLAALVCAAALGAAVLFQDRLPGVLTQFGNGLPLSLALSLVIAMVVAFAMGAVRPRNIVLLPLSALYAGGAVVAGQITGSSIMAGTILRTPPDQRAPAGLADVTVPNFTEGLPTALSLYQAPLAEMWAVWLYIAVAALAALCLLTFRVVRVRRAQTAPAEPEPQEPEYRAPFEPAQPPKQDLFTPRRPARD